jgi:predicted dithiol-disulfide oxidoreductase (DUF899 family)
MTKESIAHPPIADRQDWLSARKALLAKEKALTRQRDALNALRRRLPMVRLDKRYVFDGPAGETSLRDAFDGRRQLIVYHFMFAPDWEAGCPGCTGFVNALGDLSLLAKRDTAFTLISRAPLPKLEQYRTLREWRVTWLSSYRSDFNYDFHVSHDEAIAPIEYNYRNKAEIEAHSGPVRAGEAHGLSVFFRLGDDLFHSYSAFARGVEGLTDARALLDTTPYGRQEDFEDSPPGWPQRPTYG